MTRAKAADIAQAITNAGYPCNVIANSDINSGWRVQVTVGLENSIPSDVVNAFVTAQGVTGKILSIIME